MNYTYQCKCGICLSVLPASPFSFTQCTFYPEWLFKNKSEHISFLLTTSWHLSVSNNGEACSSAHCFFHFKSPLLCCSFRCMPQDLCAGFSLSLSGLFQIPTCFMSLFMGWWQELSPGSHLRKVYALPQSYFPCPHIILLSWLFKKLALSVPGLKQHYLLSAFTALLLYSISERFIYVRENATASFWSMWCQESNLGLHVCKSVSLSISQPPRLPYFILLCNSYLFMHFSFFC